MSSHKLFVFPWFIYIGYCKQASLCCMKGETVSTPLDKDGKHIYWLGTAVSHSTNHIFLWGQSKNIAYFNNFIMHIIEFNFMLWCDVSFDSMWCALQHAIHIIIWKWAFPLGMGLQSTAAQFTIRGYEVFHIRDLLSLALYGETTRIGCTLFSLLSSLQHIIPTCTQLKNVY